LLDGEIELDTDKGNERSLHIATRLCEHRFGSLSGGREGSALPAGSELPRQVKER
jgi:hypothetical protein